MASTPSQSGASAETLACDYLCRAGLTLVTRNYRSPFGEIDLIMHQDETTVFIEVRYRRSSRFGAPAETVNAQKQAKLRATAEHFLQQQRRRARPPCRFDILAVEGENPAQIHWLQNAF